MSDPPELSVVIACDHSGHTLPRTLRSVAESLTGVAGEVLLVYRGDEPPHGHTVAGENARYVTAPADASVPVLWARGIKAATGEVVALTTGHFEVSRTWARALLSEVRTGAVGASGPIRLEAHTDVVSRAVYFTRYSSFMNPPEGPAHEIPGDNAAYARSALVRHASTFARGFWEVEFHRRIRAEGGSLTFTNDASAQIGLSYRFGPFFRQRFHHGRHYGAYRVRHRTPRWRVAGVAPLVPLVLVARIFLRAVRVPGTRIAALSALPALIPFTIAWAAGEAIGALAGTGEPGFA